MFDLTGKVALVTGFPRARRGNGALSGGSRGGRRRELHLGALS